MPEKPIILKRPQPTPASVGVVRLSQQAELIARRLSACSGLPVSRVVSEIIIQAEGR